MKTIERREERRLRIRWLIRLSGRTIGSVETTTVNLSARSFYCILDRSPLVGDRMECQVHLPRSAYQKTAGAIVCQAEVIRVDETKPGLNFGVACRIRDFRYIRKREFNPCIN